MEKLELCIKTVVENVERILEQPDNELRQALEDYLEELKDLAKPIILKI